MKKLLFAGACSLTAMSTFAMDSTEQRILLLEQQLNALKTELQQQKQAQTELQHSQVAVQHDLHTQQQQLEAQQNSTKKLIDLGDNVDVYGVLRFDGAVDFKSSPNGRGRTINQINRAPFDEPDSTRSDFTAAATRIGVNIKDLAGNPNVKAKIEADFWSNGGRGDGNFRIRHAYLNAYNWTFGQTTSLMSNIEVATDAVDYSLLLGNAVVRHPQVQYGWTLNPENSINVALEYMGGGDRSSALPALTAKYSYKNGPAHIIANGFVNEKQAQGATEDIEDIGWGVGLGGRYRFDAQNSIQAQYYHMVGDQRIVSFLTQGATSDGEAWGGDFSVDPLKKELLLNRFDSLTLGYSHIFSPQWRANIAASVVNFDDDSAFAKANPESNKRLSDYVINGIYSPWKNVDLGAEYHHGKRETFDGREADVSRINMTAKYSF